MHHDFKVLPNGNILMIVAEKKLYADVIAAGFNPALLDTAITTDGFMVPDSVVEIQPTAGSGGTVVWQWHVWDHLIQDYSSSKSNYGVVSQHPELIDANGPGIKIPEFWNHLNGIDYNASLDQIMLSARNQNEVWVIDHSTTTAQAAGHSGGAHGKGGDLLYRWGDPLQYKTGTAANEMLYQQHNTQWIASDCPGAGHILVFNNGLGRPAGAYSTIDEFAPPVDASGNYTRTAGSAYGPSGLTWTYVASPPTSFYSAEISGAQRLPNGDTFICEGNTGRLFEVTAAGQIVWQYQNPVCDTGALEQGSSLPADANKVGGYMTAVFRAMKYPATYAAFAGRTLSPSGKIETYPDWIELRNPTAAAVDMSGMYLTNDASTPKKFQIPTGVLIPAGGYLLFWADNNTTLGSRHTNFTVSSTGGTISLYDIDGVTRVDTVTYGAQTTNVSYGRYPNGTGAWQAMTTVTPGAANAAASNQAPTDIALSTSTVAENLPAGTTVGTLSTTDPDTGNTFTYALVSGTGSTDNALFSISGSTLLTAASFDYETKNSYSVRVRSTDQGGLYTEKVFTITVQNVNEPPTDLTLSNTTVPENQPVGTTVGAFGTADPDAGNAFTYTLVSGTGSTDNGSFTISVNTLRTAAVFNCSVKDRYSIRVKTTDDGGLSLEKAITISVTSAPMDWTGTISDHWENGANWWAGIVPGLQTQVRISGAAARQPVLYQNQTVRGLDLGSGAVLAFAPGAPKTLVTKSLNVAEAGSAPTARLDIGSGALIVGYDDGAASPLADVKRWIAEGYNGMTWTGNGITSSAAAANPIIYGVGYAQNDMLFAPYNNFAGQPVDSSCVLVKYTYAGDLNLDGRVDDNDVSILGLFYDNGATTSHRWSQGDLFGYDGRIDDNDVAILGLTYGLGVGNPLGSSPVGAAPEPAAMPAVATAAPAPVVLSAAASLAPPILVDQPAALDAPALALVLSKATPASAAPALAAPGMAPPATAAPDADGFGALLTIDSATVDAVPLVFGGGDEVARSSSEPALAPGSVIVDVLALPALAL